MKKIKMSFMHFLMVAGVMLAATPVHSEGSGPFVTISGFVKDAKSKSPIAYAAIYVTEAGIGTVANIEGFFTLKLEKPVRAKAFTISHIGFQTMTVDIEENIGKSRDFLLTAQMVNLPEVVVRPKDARELVRSAIFKIPENYPNQGQRLTGFYRETIKRRRDFVAVAEAVVDVEQSPYRAFPGSDRVKILQARKSGDVKRMDTLLVKLQGGPHVSMMLDVVKTQDIILDQELLKYFNYEIVDLVMIEGRTNYVVNFKPNAIFEVPMYSGTFFIDVQDLAFTRIDFELDISDVSKATKLLVVRMPPRLRFNPLNVSYTVSYRKIGDKYFVNYMRNELEFYADWRRRLFRTRYTIMSEMAITERITSTERIARREAFKQNQILADMVMSYFDKDFWGSYNIIEPDKSIETAIDRFNRRLTRD